VPEALLTAADVRDALAKHWPAASFLSIPEAPQNAIRQGRTLDLLVISLWQSRGYEREGIEIKVSVSDWHRELAEAAKADWWWEHVHRFWVAVPAKIAERVKAELPSGWGLLSCTQDGVKILVKPVKHAAKPLPETTYLGLLRAASGAGWNALQRARDVGFAEGQKRARDQISIQSGDHYAKRELKSLQEAVARFEAASGVSLKDEWGAGTIGAQVALVARLFGSPEWTARDIKRSAEQAAEVAKGLTELAEGLTALFKPEAVSA
jgi:hypothetical protein